MSKPKGSHERNHRESHNENYLIKKVKEHGGEVRKLRYIGRRSATDRLVLLPGRHIFVELKATRVKNATFQQKREHDKLKAAGCEVRVCHTLDQIDGLFI